MLDVKLLRENPDAVRLGLERRGATEKMALVGEAIDCDIQWRKLKTQVEDLRHRQNQVTAEVAALKKQGKSADEKLNEVKEIPNQIRALDTEADQKLARLNQILMSIPNLLHESVPVGRSEEDNVVVRKWGELPDFGFEP